MFSDDDIYNADLEELIAMQDEVFDAITDYPKGDSRAESLYEVEANIFEEIQSREESEQHHEWLHANKWRF